MRMADMETREEGAEPGRETLRKVLGLTPEALDAQEQELEAKEKERLEIERAERLKALEAEDRKRESRARESWALLDKRLPVSSLRALAAQGKQVEDALFAFFCALDNQGVGNAFDANRHEAHGAVRRMVRVLNAKLQGRMDKLEREAWEQAKAREG